MRHPSDLGELERAAFDPSAINEYHAVLTDRLRKIVAALDAVTEQAPDRLESCATAVQAVVMHKNLWSAV
jgi:hypothetical protein